MRRKIKGSEMETCTCLFKRLLAAKAEQNDCFIFNDEKKEEINNFFVKITFVRILMSKGKKCH